MRRGPSSYFYAKDLYTLKPDELGPNEPAVLSTWVEGRQILPL